MCVTESIDLCLCIRYLILDSAYFPKSFSISMSQKIDKYTARQRKIIQKNDSRSGSYAWFENAMEVKRTRKGCRARRIAKPQISSAPTIGLITENVLVPKTKSICIEKARPKRGSFFAKKTQLVKPRKYKSKTMVPLLKQPAHLAMDAMSKSQSFKQIAKPSEKLPPLISKSPTFPALNRLQKLMQRMEEKKEKGLPFPAPIPKSLHLKSSSEEIVANRVQTKPKKTKRPEKISKKRSRIVEENKVTSLISLQSLSDFQNLEWSSADTVTSMREEMQLLENNVSSIPILFTVTTTSTKTDSYNREEDLPIMCREPALSKFDVAMSQTISSVASHKSGLTFPVKWTESENSEPVQFAMFDLPATNDDTTTPEKRDVWPSRDFQYSWKDTDRSILLSLANSESVKSEYPCRIKYSWQVLGRSSQTSRTLLDSLIKENVEEEEEEVVHDCSIKYSWQIIGISTQTSKRDFNVSQCQSIVSILSPKANTRRDASESKPHALVMRRNGKQFFVLNNQCTQTCAHKEIQTNCIEIHVKSR